MSKKLSLKEALNIAIEHNPQILEAEAKCQLSKATFNKFDADFSPSLDLSAGFNSSSMSRNLLSGNRTNNSESKEFGPQAELTLRVPIFEGGKSFSQKKRSNALVTKSLIEIGKLQQIPIIDHIIFGDDNYYSFYEKNDFMRKIL